MKWSVVKTLAVPDFYRAPRAVMAGHFAGRVEAGSEKERKQEITKVRK